MTAAESILSAVFCGAEGGGDICRGKSSTFGPNKAGATGNGVAFLD
jgi:hypothetical protein